MSELKKEWAITNRSFSIQGLERGDELTMLTNERTKRIAVIVADLKYENMWETDKDFTYHSTPATGEISIFSDSEANMSNITQRLTAGIATPAES